MNSADVQRRDSVSPGQVDDPELRFRAIFDAAFQLMGLLDSTGIVQEVNQTTLNAFGFQQGDVIGRPIWEVFEEVLDENGLRRLRKAVAAAAAGELGRFEVTATLQGEVVYVDASMKPILLGSGEVAGIIAEGRDVTELRRAGSELRLRSEQLARAQRIAHIGSWEWEVKSGQLSWSDEMYRIYGLDPHEPITYERYISLVHAEDRDRVQWLIADALATRHPFAFYHGIARPDGSVRVIHCEGVVLADADGAVSGMAGTGHDITERRAAEEALKVANQELLRRNRELQQFANAASHDLQEPLRKVSSFSELLLNEFGSSLDDEGKFYLERVRDAAIRMSALVRDLLSFSQTTFDRQDFRPVHLNAVVEEVLSALEVTIRETGARVAVARLPDIVADQTQMHQLLQNLVGNAVKVARGGVPAVVQVRGRITRDRMTGERFFRLSVSDNGIGFEERHLERILAPFQRLHSQSEYPGTGMGLAICRRIVQRHGGTIAASSKPGIGSTFTVTLPVHGS